ncbi:putative integral membrane protein [Babesia bovis T2Bo]|uniref:putative integral membrane protein n=1 Tax=Babesia bovis T2Bo TaxID=484906 RepID=UPI001C34F9CE|nr:putative integral membrane protein [Babesia bovis T2Bo]KAG6440219.1 putative integral membrane protein [Babesia bovis T2Bo]
MLYLMLQYLLAAIKLLVAISPLLVIVTIFVINKNWNQRSSDGSRKGLRSTYVDSDDEDETKED